MPEVDRRAQTLASDAATIVEVCLELLQRLEEAGERYDTLTVLYATAPLRTADDIRATLSLLVPGECEFAMAAAEFEQPVHQALQLRPDGRAVPLLPELVSARADRAGRFAAGNGSTYCAFVDAFRRARSFYGQLLKLHLMPKERSVDIDTAEDLKLAMFYWG